MKILENEAQWLAEYQSGWLSHYQETGETNWKIYKRPTNTQAPKGPGVDLSQSRLVLITSAGSYLGESREPYDAGDLLGDYTIRTYPSSTPLSALAIAQEHYDHKAVNTDRQVLIPLRHLEDMVAEGVIRELSPSVISFHGYQPDATRTISETIPLVVAAAKKEGAQAALLVPA
jgi:hypothetical protein